MAAGQTYDNTFYAGIYQKVVVDSSGNYRFDPDSMSHNYTYNSDGTIATDAATDGTNVFTKTYTYTNGNLTTESLWVKTT